jgi:hypothetical protein
MGNEIARATDGVSIGAGVGLLEPGRVHTLWVIDRWDEDATRWAAARLGRKPIDADFHKLKVKPYLTTEVHGNLITTAGWTRASNLLTNQGSTQALTSTAVRIGAGNGAGTAAAGDTDLSASAGSANRWFQTVSGNGTVSTNTLAFSASFGTADGNFAWNEIGTDVGTPTVTSGNTVNALLYNHKTSIAQGTKASGQTWTATLTFTYT